MIAANYESLPEELRAEFEEKGEKEHMEEIIRMKVDGSSDEEIEEFIEQMLAQPDAQHELLLQGVQAIFSEGRPADPSNDPTELLPAIEPGVEPTPPPDPEQQAAEARIRELDAAVGDVIANPTGEGSEERREKAERLLRASRQGRDGELADTLGKSAWWSKYVTTLGVLLFIAIGLQLAAATAAQNMAGGQQQVRR
jgi:hypothetical protein